MVLRYPYPNADQPLEPKAQAESFVSISKRGGRPQDRLWILGDTVISQIRSHVYGLARVDHKRNHVIKILFPQDVAPRTASSMTSSV